ncbi:MAG: winged helix-turn-helix transcriptional regulator [Streptosporangiales bacterium]|nr:winged helix-turn-helix transcriptional regulator [Streptosporangiales bacterium]
MSAKRRPIGYLLKHLDRLIEDGFERTLIDEGFTRRHWQLLNVVHEGPATRDAAAAKLASFLVEGRTELDRAVDDLARRGLVSADDDTLSLTDEGERAFGSVQDKLSEFRGLVTKGLDEDEYGRAVDALERMAGNLEAYAEPLAAPHAFGVHDSIGV